jgi:hypothetical protein
MVAWTVTMAARPKREWFVVPLLTQLETGAVKASTRSQNTNIHEGKTPLVRASQ